MTLALPGLDLRSRARRAAPEQPSVEELAAARRLAQLRQHNRPLDVLSPEPAAFDGPVTWVVPGATRRARGPRLPALPGAEAFGRLSRPALLAGGATVLLALAITAGRSLSTRSTTHARQSAAAATGLQVAAAPLAQPAEERLPLNSAHLSQKQAVAEIRVALGNEGGSGAGEAAATAGEDGTDVADDPGGAVTNGWTAAGQPPRPAAAASGWNAGTQQQAVSGTGTAAQTVRAPRGGQVALWPVVGPISSFFGPSHPLGIDIAVNSGTPIRAMAPGRIAYVGGDPCCSYGYRVDIDHGNGVLTRYGHMLYLPALQVGAPVRQGDIIGLAGSTGFSTGPHLHFEVRLRDMVVDPLLVLPAHP